MDAIRVLIVDDHGVLRDGIHTLLSLSDDLEVVGEAADGREAVEKTRQLAPDVVVMDLAMPLMDGLEATRRIVKENPNVKVLVLTAYDNREYVRALLRAGACGFLPKKALASELTAAIKAAHQGDSFLYPSVAKMLIQEYLQGVGDGEEQDDYDGLTAREREVLKLTAEGRANREIADLLFVSVKTVLGHRTNIMEKLGIHNRTELIKYAIRKGLINLHE